MATDKKSFVLYTELIHTVNLLSDEKAGKLIKHLLAYVNDLDPVASDDVVALVFEPIKQQLKRDLNRYEKIKIARVEAGRNGGKSKAYNQTKQLLAKPSKTKQNQANVAVNVNVNVINIERRKLLFADTLKPFYEKYPPKLINDFFNYWTEPNKSGSKFKQELQKTWDTGRRLETWAAREKDFVRNYKPEEKPTAFKVPANANIIQA